MSASTIVGGVATFLGATGFLAGLGFLVQQALFVLLGAPTPPFATIDYLRVAGYFLFDLIVLVVLLSGVLWGVVPVLVLLLALSVILALWPPRPRTRALFSQRYAATWAWVVDRWKHCLGTAGLVACVVLLVVFTFGYHYPVFAQRGIASTRLAPDAGCPRPAAIDAMWPLQIGWRIVESRCATIRARVLDAEGLASTQATYANGAFFVLLLAVYLLLHPYNQLTAAGRLVSSGNRWLWLANAALLTLSLTYLPSGYAVLFLDKQAPLVRFEFKEQSRDATVVPVTTTAPATTPGPTALASGEGWRAGIRDRNWYLLFQSEKEVWLYRAPYLVVVQKEQLDGIELRDSHWIFE